MKMLYVSTLLSTERTEGSTICYTTIMNEPKLILLYGFASSGKTTLAKKYTDEHPLSIAIEGDQIISMMGQWRKHENEARKLVFEHTKSIAKKHLSAGHDVLLPYLLTNPSHAQELEMLAKESSVPFHEVSIEINRDDAIERLLARGVWGEEGSPRLTNDDMPEINNLFDTMETAMSERDTIKRIHSELGDIQGTYEKLLLAITS